MNKQLREFYELLWDASDREALFDWFFVYANEDTRKISKLVKLGLVIKERVGDRWTYRLKDPTEIVKHKHER